MMSRAALSLRPHLFLGFMRWLCAVALLFGTTLAEAQECRRPPACRAEEINAEGCCPHVAPAAPRTVTPPADPHCTGGKEISADTAGHCCWGGQVWSHGRCVGVPSSCPSNFVMNEAGQTCYLPACKPGQNRADDGVNCCWAGQGWSRTRSACVGVPTCPKGMEVEGSDHCVGVDKDGDGIPNAVDKCPDVAEDFNGYKDDDGCPDEPERLAMVLAQERARDAAAATAAAAAAEIAATQRKAAELAEQARVAEQVRLEAARARQAA